VGKELRAAALEKASKGLEKDMILLGASPDPHLNPTLSRTTMSFLLNPNPANSGATAIEDKLQEKVPPLWTDTVTSSPATLRDPVQQLTHTQPCTGARDSRSTAADWHEGNMRGRWFI